MRKIISGIVLLCAVAGAAFAGGHQVPEIDLTTGMGALGAIGGAMLIIRGRRRKN